MGLLSMGLSLILICAYYCNPTFHGSRWLGLDKLSSWTSTGNYGQECLSAEVSLGKLCIKDCSCKVYNISLCSNSSTSKVNVPVLGSATYGTSRKRECRSPSTMNKQAVKMSGETIDSNLTSRN